MQYSRNHWLEDTNKAYRLVLCFFVVAIITTATAIASWGLFIDRVNESRLIINCGSFTSVGEATAFTIEHPEYRKKLNPLNKAIACTSYHYGNNR